MEVRIGGGSNWDEVAIGGENQGWGHLGREYAALGDDRTSG